MGDISSVPESIKRLAATKNQIGKRWLPLWVHSLDTCGVAELLLDRWLSDGARKALADQLQDGQLSLLVGAAALFHDIGKATALFQTRISQDSPELQEYISGGGLPLLNQAEVAQLQTMHFPHAAAGQALIMMNGAPLTYAEVVGAHHGIPWPEGAELQDELQDASDWKDPRAVSLWGGQKAKQTWREAQKDCILWMLNRIDLESLRQLPTISQSTAVLLSGLVIMADWIASNEDFFPLLFWGETDPGDLQKRLIRGWERLSLPERWQASDEENLVRLSKKQFGFSPNGVQLAMLQAVLECDDPGLMILEAPMGLGKTEAALLSADLLAKKGAGGIFFGLPTQATANAIFDRVIQWGENQPGANKNSIRLAHGMADLNERYQALMAGNSSSSVDEDGGQERLMVHEWFRGRTQALLADFVVGTVDQVLMASLRQKHLMLRHLGLCGKTVIIDECHAYDAYMNQYLEETLRWLGRYHTPVIMLSATLPADRRAAFAAAYLNKSGALKKFRTEEWYGCQAYPALTWTDRGKVYQKELKYDGSRKRVQLHHLETGNDTAEQAGKTAQLLAEALSEGGCAAIVLNTVNRAQTFASVLKKMMPGFRILLLHSRFVMPDRLRHEENLLRHMGKQSSREDRDRVIIVGTQVIEQSLDYDTDLMISDLCPMDLLMQRIGRLHRHPDRHDQMRPVKLKEPVCWVMGCGENLDKGSEAVYGGLLLMRTLAFLPETVSLPEDIPRLVNAVYDETIPLPTEPPGYEDALQKHRQKESKLKQDARAFCIHHPEGEYSTLLTGDIPADDEHARAQVRAGEMTMNAILAQEHVNGEISLLPWLSDGRIWHKDEMPSWDESRIFLSQRIGLSFGLLKSLLREMSWDDLQKRLAVPDAWKESTWLRDQHLLLLDEDMNASLGSLRLTYDKDVGLSWQKEEDAT